MWNRPRGAKEFLAANSLLNATQISKASTELLDFLAAVEQGTIEDDELQVVLHADTSSESMARFAQTSNAAQIPSLGIVYVKLSAQAIKDALDKNDIRLIEVDFPGALELNLSVPAIGARSFSHTFSASGENIVVAVIDDQVDKDHPAFGGRVVWKDNFSGKPWGDVSNPSRPEHATMVAGIIVGSGKGSKDESLAGVAPKCTIWNYRVVPLKKLDGRYTNLGVVEAIIAAADQGAHVINLSWGKPIADLNATSDLCKAVTYAFEKGCLVVKSAGNADGIAASPRPNITSPGESPCCVTVGALDNVGISALPKSSAGVTGSGIAKPDLAAPGGSIDGPLPGGEYEESDSPIFNSTSFAAPHVAGAAALVLSVLPCTPAKLMETLFGCCRRTPEVEKDPLKYGRGVLDMSLIKSTIADAIDDAVEIESK